MKQKYPLVLFDLDGTLTDSGEGITNSVIETLRHMNWPIPEKKILLKFIGPPLWSSFTHFCGMNSEQTETAVEYYRKVYNSTGIFQNKVYDGIMELLSALRKAGVCLAVATSKPAIATAAVLDHFNLRPFFKYVSAEDESERGGGKEIRILQVVEESGFSAGQSLMIGDTKFDAAGARKAGTNFIGVLYGFGTKEEMQKEGGTEFAENLSQLSGMLIDKE